jgi:uncharacterized LabA/DUF88 family protein
MTSADTTFFPGEWPEQRVALFVDTQNLYYSARDNYDRNLDYLRLRDVALRGRLLQQATAYTVEREGESTAFGFVTKLGTLGYRVRRRKVRVHRSDDAGRVVLEGDWDMGIAVDIIRAWDHFDVLALASGDGDFRALCELVQERGKRVEVLAFRESSSQELLDIADRFINLPEQEQIFVR